MRSTAARPRTSVPGSSTRTGNVPPTIASTSTLIRNALLVPVGSAVPNGPVDIRMRDGVVAAVDVALSPERDEDVIDAGGRWAIPGLWDQHVHMLQWARTTVGLDVGGTSGPADVTRIVGDHVAGLPAGRDAEMVAGFGYRIATWSERPTVAELDAVSGEHPVVLVSGDAHNGWLNSRALAHFGVPPRTGILTEHDWYPVFTRFGEELAALPATKDAYRRAVREAAARGVVGIVDLELAPGYLDWPGRLASGVAQLRVRPATYPDRLEEVIAAGLRSGDPLGDGGTAEMGPLKIISDGSLNTRTAFCCEPYADAAELRHPRGGANYSPQELLELIRRARVSGFDVSVHAIGDAAVTAALDAFQAVGAAGSIEHAQLVRWQDVPRMASLGLRASVQPAHLLDDRDVTMKCWPDREDRCFAFRSMLDAGVDLRLGSDAPVAPLDPWLAMAAAVHRSGDDREPWNAGQSLTAAEALAASTDGRGTVARGSRADVVLLDDDPLAVTGDSAAVGEHLRGMRVAATFMAGQATHLDL